MTVISPEIINLEKLYNYIKGKLPTIEEELKHLIHTEDDNVILLYSRRCLEIIVTDLCEKELKRPRKTEPLQGVIEKLNKEEKVPSHIITSMSHLNSLSVYGVHPKEYDPQQVRAVLINLTTVISWYLKYRSVETDIDLESIEKVLEINETAREYTIQWQKVMPWSLVGLLAIVIVIFSIFYKKSSSEPLPVQRFIYNLPPGETIGSESLGSSVAISPDGSKLIFVSHKGDSARLYLRMMNEFQAKPIPSTEGATAPFFSADSKWIGFFADGNLKKILVPGSAPQIICEAKSGCQGCWGRDNYIVFTDAYKACLMRVPATGGSPEQLTTGLKFSKDESEHTHYWPQILPRNKAILFTAYHNKEDIRIAAYSPETGERWNLIEQGSHARYVKTGHIIYAWQGYLLGVPFNLKKMKITGQPVIILNDITMTGSGIAHFGISDNGSLVYVPGKVIENENKLLLVDRSGAPEALNIPVGIYQSPCISPDGKQILISKIQEKANLWIYGLERSTFRRFTEKELETFWAIWTPDGKRIVFNSNLDGEPEVNLFWKISDGIGPIETLTDSKYHQQPKFWSVDGKSLIYTEGIHPETGMDIYILQMEGDTTPKPLLNSRFNETHPSLSPDGRWMTYVSDEPGREEVFVCQFPGLGNITQISIEGGMEPLWSPDGKEIFYRDVSGDKVMVVSFDSDPELRIGKPVLLFQGKYKGSSGPWGRNYDITPDGKHFLMIAETEMMSEATQINIVLNWSEELKRLVPSDNKR